MAITVLYPLPTTKLIEIINRNAAKIPYETAKEVAAIVDCHYGGAKEKMPRDLFEKRIKFDFERYQFWGTQAYELYLTNLYGNYMELPPEDRRVTHHDFTAYWKQGSNSMDVFDEKIEP